MDQEDRFRFGIDVPDEPEYIPVVGDRVKVDPEAIHVHPESYWAGVAARVSFFDTYKALDHSNKVSGRVKGEEK